MQRYFTYQITEEFHNYNISSYLKSLGYPHAVMVHLKKTPESILLNGRWEYVNTPVKTGDLLEIKLIETESSEHIPPVFAPFTIVHEDEDILVIDKPANMPIHPSLNHYEHTLANAVCHYFASQNIPYTFRCVNRLDKNTTGLTIVAKHMLSSAILSRDVASKTIKREYLAIVKGNTKDFGTIDMPIARKDASTIERCINYETGERAVTHYRKIDTKNGYTLLSLILETGRTHQIRVHMSSIGHPLIGDFLYHPSSDELPRQALHSHKLEFIHPVTKVPMTFTAPLPQDMNDFWENL